MLQDTEEAAKSLKPVGTGNTYSKDLNEHESSLYFQKLQ